VLSLSALTHSEPAQFEVDPAPFSAEWKGLSREMLFDIFSVKKANRFTFEQRGSYDLADFVRSVKAAESTTTLGRIGVSEYVEGDEFGSRANGVSFDPRWLIDDSVFSTTEWVFGVSQFVDGLRAQQMAGSEALNVRSFVIPQSTVSLYDDKTPWDLKDIGFIEAFLRRKSVKRIGCRSVHSDSKLSVKERAEVIERIYDDIKSGIAIHAPSDQRECRRMNRTKSPEHVQ